MLRYLIQIVSFIVIGFLTGCESIQGPTFEAVQVTKRTVEGCEFLARDFKWSKPEMNASVDAINNKYTSSWSGACEGGYLSGPGYLTVSREGVVLSRSWQIAQAKKMTLVHFNYVDSSGDIYYFRYRNEGQRSPDYLRPSECLSDKECKALHDFRITLMGAAKVAAEDDVADKSTLAMRATVARNEAERKANYETSMKRIAQIEQQVEQENKELKQRILAERNQAQGTDNSSNTVAMVGALLQGVAAAKGKNTVPLQSFGAGLPGNTSPQNMPTSSGGKDLGANVKYGQPVQCTAIIARGTAENLAIKNNCGYAINITFCVQQPSGPNARVAPACESHDVALHQIRPRGDEPLYGAAHSKTIIGACKAPFVMPMDLIVWKDNTFTSPCIYSSRYQSEAP